jgi:hypothetical protein
MNTTKNKKAAILIMTIALLGFLSSCVVVVHDHPHRHYWHHGGGFHRIS